MVKRQYECILHKKYEGFVALIRAWSVGENNRLIESTELYRRIYRDSFSITYDFHLEVKFVDTGVIHSDPKYAARPRGY
jgi:hypothetical protein